MKPTLPLVACLVLVVTGWLVPLAPARAATVPSAPPVLPVLPGAVDPSTLANPPNPNDVVRVIRTLEDGKIMVVGQFTEIGGNNSWRLARLNADLSYDLTFQAGPGADGVIYSLALQDDGMILIGGEFMTYNGVTRPRLARLNADGSLDESFRADDTLPAMDGAIWSIAVQPDGQILIGGDFNAVDGLSYGKLARLASTGELDTSFGTEGAGINGTVRSIVIRTPDLIYVGGSFSAYQNVSANNLIALDGAGGLNPVFETGFGPVGQVNTLALQPDGRLLVGGFFERYVSRDGNKAVSHLVRVLPNGAMDPFFDPGKGPDQAITSIAIQPDGRLLVGGGFTSFDQQNRLRLVRLLPEGAIDPLFDPDLAFDSWIETIALDAEGRILVGGDFQYVKSTRVARFARLVGGDPAPFAPVIIADPAGVRVFEGDHVRLSVRVLGAPFPTLQWFHGDQPIAGADSSELQVFNVKASDAGSYWVSAVNVLGSVRSASAQLTVYPSPTDFGSPDVGFYGGSGPDQPVFTMLPDGPGKCYVGGNFLTFDGTSTPGIARLTESGALDSTFLSPFGNPGGQPPPQVYSIVRDRVGRVLIGGLFPIRDLGYFQLIRANSDGTLDPTFTLTSSGLGGVVSAIAEQADGKLLAVIGQAPSSVGFVQYTSIRRFFANGTLDANYLPESRGSLPQPILGLALQADGKAVAVGGRASRTAIPNNLNIVRLLPDGSPDPSFRVGSAANSTISAVALQSDGRILIAGAFTRFNGRPQPRLARLNVDGSLDPSFQVGFGPDNNVDSLHLLRDGRFYAAGQFTSVDGIPRTRVARFNPNGSLDLSFDPLAGPNDRVRVVAHNGADSVWIGGQFSTVNDLPRPRLARLHDGDPFPLRPSILYQPYSDPVFVGMDVSLSVVAESWPVPSYEWRRGPSPLAGETNWVLSFRNIQQNQQGAYSVGLSSPLGKVDSVDVELIVNPAPVNAGATDLSFYTGAGPNDQVRSIVVLPNGGTLIGGRFSEVDGIQRNALAKLQPDGSVDLDFDTSQGPQGHINVLLPAADGKWIAGGDLRSTNSVRYTPLVRFLANGLRDTTFNPPVFNQDASAQVFGIIPQNDRKLLVFGSFYLVDGVNRFSLMRMSVDGTLDTLYRPLLPGPSGSIHAVAVLPDDRSLIGGNFTGFDGRPKPFLVRLDSEGNLDASFNPTLNGEVRCIHVQPDGRILIVGAFQIVDGQSRVRLARLLPDGRLDRSFDPSTGPNNLVYSLLVQSDQKVIIGGAFTAVNDTPRYRIARLLANGSLDRQFDPGEGIQNGSAYLDEYGAPVDLTAVHAVGQQVDGQILAGGEFTRAGKLPRNFVVRLNDRERLPLLQWNIAGDLLNSLELRWDNGILQAAPEVEGPWSDLRNATSPQIINASDGNRYFRLRLR
ncbi:MAG: immunoglobulin domain-containing protein [Verrucomicrobiales bacterium]|nr:immunoglobulin domain-containing protein [Verrucomicrobiales bacterium]